MAQPATPLTIAALLQRERENAVYISRSARALAYLPGTFERTIHRATGDQHHDDDHALRRAVR